MWWRTRMTMSERSLLATIRSVKSLPCSIPWLTLHSRYLRRLSSYGCIWIQSPHNIDFTSDPDIREILGLKGRTVIRPASFYGSNVIDITQNRQVIQVYLSLMRPSDLKIANQNSNLLTTMIIDDPTTNYCRSVEDICIQTITRFIQLIFVFKDLEGNIMQLNCEFKL